MANILWLLGLFILGFLEEIHGTRFGDKKLLNGLHLRFPAAIREPSLYLIKGPDGNLTFKGIDKNVADWLAACFNITYSFVPMNKTEITNVGFRQAGIAMLMDGRIDMLFPPLTLYLERMQIMDFTYPIAIENYKISSPWPKELNRLSAPVRPFQLSVWILFIVSLVAITIVVSLLTRRSGQASRMDHGLRVSIYVLSVALSQGDFLPYRNHSIRIVAAGWCLMVVVLVNSYAGTLTSYLTLPIYTKTIDSFEDLAKRTDVEMVVDANSIFLETVLEAKNGTYKILGDSIRRHPENIIKSVPEVIDKMFSGKYAYASPGSYVEYLLAQDFKKRKNQCRLTISKSLGFNSLVSYGLPKKGPYNNIINYQFLQLWEFGMASKWFEGKSSRYKQCIVKPHPKMAVLKLQDLYSAFALLGFGLVLSFLVFLMEKLHFKFHSN